MLKQKIITLLKLVLVNILFKKYVKNNKVIIKDIQQNILHRCNHRGHYNTKKQFKHLMYYYTDFCYLFFWRINKHNFLNSMLFYDDFTSKCKIFRSTKIAGGMVSYHPISTVINAKKIGENFVFRNNTTIGNKNNDNTLCPVIGNNVELGANVVIIGPITIGDNAMIGAGSVVVKNILANSIAVGNPAKVVKKIDVS